MDTDKLDLVDIIPMQYLDCDQLLFLFIRDGQFPPGHVRTSAVFAAFNTWLASKGAQDIKITQIKITHALKRFPGIGTWREDGKTYAYLKRFDPNMAEAARQARMRACMVASLSISQTT